MAMIPPEVNERDFTSALQAFENVVGSEWVFTSDEDVALYKNPSADAALGAAVGTNTAAFTLETFNDSVNWLGRCTHARENLPLRNKRRKRKRKNYERWTGSSLAFSPTSLTSSARH